ncbi:hypothetical protein [Metabacillus halosaccharovorans]|uniref:hypothetical protein n=1 Tax=Metabacillus halosaccharovorans TaxID=930124 RepID=UPI0020402286|nr:hypothetical protein [Metabacillus halosaccharovorans]MCM3442930.1 hypothetical protein [Metabacillus halosaccharovorans]
MKNESIRSVIAGYGTMLASSFSVKDYLELKEVGGVTVKGIEIRRPVYLCRRNRDEEIPKNCSF